MMGTYLLLGLPVSATNMEVIRVSRRAISEDHRTDPEMKMQRRQFYLHMLDCHRQAKALYFYLGE